MKWKLNTSSIQWHKIGILAPKVINRGMAENGNNGRTKSSRENITFHSYITSTLGNLWQVVNSKEIGWQHCYGTIRDCSSHGSSLGLGLIPPSSFPQLIHIWAFNQLLRSPLYIQIHTYRFSHCPLIATLPGTQVFFWYLGGSLPDPRSLAFCMHLKVASLGWIQCLLPSGAMVFLAVGVKGI